MGPRRITILVVVILLGTLLPIVQEQPISADLSNPSALKTHTPIYINGNGQFIKANGMVSGNGTLNNPYIIENWSIDAYTAVGIKIENSNAHFVIRNCRIYNGSKGSKTNSGIYINKATNGTIMDNRVSLCYSGIALMKSEYIIVSNNTVFDILKGSGVLLSPASFCKVYDNMLYRCRYGINMYISCFNNFVFNNTIYDILIDGIRVYSSYNNQIILNNVTNCSVGVFVYSKSMNNTFISNKINNNRLRGLEVATYNNNTFYNNSINNNLQNLALKQINMVNHFSHTISTNNTINGRPVYHLVGESDKVVPSDGAFVGIVNCSNITVRNSTMFSNYNGILISHSSNCTIENNTLYDTNYGIFLYESNDNKIFDNKIHDTAEHGIYLYRSCSGNDIFINEIYNCSSDGIYFYYKINNNLIQGNNIHDTENSGINIYYYCEENIIQNNTLRNHSYGIYLRSLSEWNKIENNTIEISGTGINLGYSSKIKLFNNSINDSKYTNMYIYTSYDNLIISNKIANGREGLIISESKNNILYKNSISNSKKYNFGVTGQSQDRYLHNISTNNTINGKPIYYFINISNGVVPIDAGYIGLVNCNNFRINDLI